MHFAEVGIWHCHEMQFGNFLLPYLFVWRTRPNAGPVVFEEVFGAVLDAGGAVRVLSGGVPLPAVLDCVIALHGRTVLFAYAIIIEIATGLKKLNLKIFFFFSRRKYCESKIRK